MPTPLSFTSASPRFGLPLVFAGQAQKEFFVNQAHAQIDALLHAAIDGESPTPPTTPEPGETWLVSAGASGSWEGQTDSLASWQAGVWVFVTAPDGTRVYDKATGQYLVMRSGIWVRPVAPAEPTGGATVDTEARAALTNLIEALRIAAILPEN